MKKLLDPSKLPPATPPTDEQLERAERDYFKYWVPIRNQWLLEMGAYAVLLDPRNSWRQRRKAALEIAATMPTNIANRDAYYELKDGGDSPSRRPCARERGGRPVHLCGHCRRRIGLG